jgi:ribosomal protein L37E
VHSKPETGESHALGADVGREIIPGDPGPSSQPERDGIHWNCQKCGGGDMIGNENEIDVCSYCGHPVEEENQRTRKPQPRSPNPSFVDMMGLTPLERATLCDEFPQLRFSINGGQRYDSEGNPDAASGYARADQVEHVQRIIFDKNSSKLAALGDDEGKRLVPRGVPDQTGCAHKMKRDPLTNVKFCIKCGYGKPEEKPAETQAE